MDSSEKLGLLALGIFLFMLLCGCPYLGSMAAASSNRETLTVVIDQEPYVKAGDKSSTYLVPILKSEPGYDNNVHEVVTVKDNWYVGNFRSTDVYNELRACTGKEVTITVAGWRIGFLSSYRNILKVDRICDPKAAPAV